MRRRSQKSGCSSSGIRRAPSRRMQPVQPADVVEVPVAHHDAFDVADVDLQRVEVVHEPADAQPAVEHQPALHITRASQ